MKSSYPVFYQYKKYSVCFDELSLEDVLKLRDAVACLSVELVHKGANF
jgi:hypothetical protein